MEAEAAQWMLKARHQTARRAEGLKHRRPDNVQGFTRPPAAQWRVDPGGSGHAGMSSGAWKVAGTGGGSSGHGEKSIAFHWETI